MIPTTGPAKLHIDQQREGNSNFPDIGSEISPKYVWSKLLNELHKYSAKLSCSITSLRFARGD